MASFPELRKVHSFRVELDEISVRSESGWREHQPAVIDQLVATLPETYGRTNMKPPSVLAQDSHGQDRQTRSCNIEVSALGHMWYTILGLDSSLKPESWKSLDDLQRFGATKGLVKHSLVKQWHQKWRSNRCLFKGSMGLVYLIRLTRSVDFCFGFHVGNLYQSFGVFGFWDNFHSYSPIAKRNVLTKMPLACVRKHNFPPKNEVLLCCLQKLAIPWMEHIVYNPLFSIQIMSPLEKLSGGRLKYFAFSHLPGDLIQFHEHTFQLGWNDQLEKTGKHFLWWWSGSLFWGQVASGLKNGRNGRMSTRPTTANVRTPRTCF